MGLLTTQLKKPLLMAAEMAYRRQLDQDGRLEREYDEYRRNKMYEDTLYNLSFLSIARQYDDPKLFENYAIWLLELMESLMPDLGFERVREQLILHYELLREVLDEVLSASEASVYQDLLERAVSRTKSAAPSTPSRRLDDGKFGIMRKTYLNLILNHQSHQAIDFIKQMAAMGTDLEDLYVEVLQEVLREVGDLWHHAKLSVDQEHYVTSVTQVVMAQFYPQIFRAKRNGHRILVCTVGSELHEIGARMVSDLFENNGWDSVYLGAALPLKQIVSGIRHHNPDLVALSVTMPHFLAECEAVAKAIRKEFPSLKIAVGGRAFSITDRLWEKLPVDHYSADGKAFVEWAQSITGKNNQWQTCS